MLDRYAVKVDDNEDVSYWDTRCLVSKDSPSAVWSAYPTEFWLCDDLLTITVI